MVRSMSPADLDPVAASATPITPDPPVRARMNASGADAEAVEVIARRLIQGGLNPAQAYEQARQQVLGEKQAVLDSMGPPPGTRRQEPEAPAPVAPVSPGQQPRTPDELIDMGMTAYRVHGATMPDGTRGRRTEALPNTDSAEAYTRRAERIPSTDPSEPGGTARYAPSDKDRDMMDLGYVPVMGPDGSTSYQLSPDTGVMGMPGGPNRGGRRADLEAPLLKADGTPVLDQDGQPVPKWAVAMADSPTGTLGEAEGSATVPVYSLSPQARQKHEAYEAERRLYRMAAKAGVPPAQFLEENKASFPDLTAGGLRSDPSARMAVQAARQADAEARKKAWQSQMMLAGGSPAKNAVNAYNQLNDPSTNDWQRLVIAMRLGQGVQGVTPLGVEANQQSLLSQLGLRVANGQGFRDAMPPGMAAAAEAKATASLPPAEQIPLHKDKPGIHPSELQYADDYVAQHYSSGGGAFGISSAFTIAEQQTAIDHLVNDMGYSPAKAQRVVDEIARRRHAGSWRGSPVRGAAAPAASSPDPAPSAPPKPAGGRVPL